MVRRKFTKEFKFEAVKLVTERGVPLAHPPGMDMRILAKPLGSQADVQGMLRRRLPWGPIQVNWR